MVDAAKNIKQIRKESEVNVSVITEERKRIEREIQQARNKINEHLDKIQDQMSKELLEVTNKTKKKSSDLNVVINEMERSIEKQQSKIDKVKKDAIDLQCFLSMKSTEAELNKIDKTINTIIDDGEVGILSISFNLDPAMENLALNANSFGHVTVEIKPFLSKSIEEISLDLQKTINTQVKQTEGCCLLDNEMLVFSDFLKDRVTVLSDNGELDFQIPINSSLHGLTVIDSQTIAVSPGGSAPHVINVVDIKDKSIKKTIPVHSEVDDRDEHTVTCCDLKGTVLWTFNDTKVLQRPWGITVDKDGNIYVVDWKDKLVVISADGKRHKQLLSAKDGLKSPTTLFYHNHTNQLLVANEKNNALLYKVV
ncbi:TRIM71 [Mytilus coruscus]|uniref:TRIM71 n=1 Tax=Mytilus coruscus TaxID=42192 RepID=A0A6J8A5X2_MYTCO|nr:TRIM71 [Mytilus coruscus]